MLVLLLAPLSDLGILLSVTAHEVVGHGLVAWALGGKFQGFSIRWDGMGYAFTSPAEGAPVWHAIVILLGGVAANRGANGGDVTLGDDRHVGAAIAVVWSVVILVNAGVALWLADGIWWG